MRPGVDIVIVSFNTRDEILACLVSLDRHPPSSLKEIFVVDNGSTDGTIEAIRSRGPRVRLVALDRNVGFGAANNVALRASNAPLVLFLNSDTIVGAGALDALIDRLTATGATAAGPRLIDGRGRPELSYGPMLSPAGEALQLVRQRAAASNSLWARRYIAALLARERVVDWVSGACLLVRRDAALQAGLFDERYFLYEEDVDLCAALRAHGGKVLFTPAAEVTHLRGRSPSSRRSEHYVRSHVAFYEKHLPRWAPLLRWWVRRKADGARSVEHSR